jgi:hypothetical protein
MTKFDIKDKLDSIAYGIYNLASNFFFALDLDAKKILNKNNCYSNIHNDEVCFIVGTGPSLSKLNQEDIHLINQEIVFGVNSLYKSEIGLQLKPKYYALMDNIYWGRWSHEFKSVLNSYKSEPPVFITDIRAKSTIDRMDENAKAIYLHPKKYPINKISKDITGNIHALMNVVSFSILTAIFMGCKKIYLLGCDYNSFCNQGYGHCYEDRGDVTSYDLAFFLRYYWLTTEFHYLLGRLAREAGAEIINLTPGSLLDAYPRSSIHEIFK